MMSEAQTVGNAGQEAAADFRPATWRGRHAVVLANDQIRCSVLQDGGIFAELAFTGQDGPGKNALWESPWRSDEGSSASDGELIRKYGDLGTGRFLDKFTGHALCLDSFGPASEDAVAAGSGLHGEASLVPWHLAVQREGPRESHLTAQARLPFANLTVQRKFHLLAGETVLRVQEQVANDGQTARPLHWVQHATIGAPMFGQTSVVSTSARQGITSAAAYSETNLIALSTGFLWPNAPLSNGGATDLRRLFAHPHTGFIVALRQPPGSKYGFVAVTDRTQGIALVYVFATEDFPWVACWEENCCRQESPWLGSVQARGLEFGTTPLPLGNAAVDHSGPVLDTPTARLAQAGETVSAPWLAALAHTPENRDSLDDVKVEHDHLLLCKGPETIRLAAAGVQEFLDSMEKTR